jgi:hypothetical protein
VLINTDTDTHTHSRVRAEADGLRGRLRGLNVQEAQAPAGVAQRHHVPIGAPGQRGDAVVVLQLGGGHGVEALPGDGPDDGERTWLVVGFRGKGGRVR